MKQFKDREGDIWTEESDGSYLFEDAWIRDLRTLNHTYGPLTLVPETNAPAEVPAEVRSLIADVLDEISHELRDAYNGAYSDSPEERVYQEMRNRIENVAKKMREQA